MTREEVEATIKEQEAVRRRQRVQEAIKYLQHYMNTYDSQMGYLEYTDEIIINDVLYGLGVALDRDQYQFADGFKKFKEVLRKHLAADIEQPTVIPEESKRTCEHGTMVANNDPKFAWRCAECGYVYGNEPEKKP